MAAKEVVQLYTSTGATVESFMETLANETADQVYTLLRDIAETNRQIVKGLEILTNQKLTS